MLPSENAETLGPLNVSSFFGSGVGGAFTVTVEVSIVAVASLVGTAVVEGLTSAME